MEILHITSGNHYNVLSNFRSTSWKMLLGNKLDTVQQLYGNWNCMTQHSSAAGATYYTIKLMESVYDYGAVV